MTSHAGRRRATLRRLLRVGLALAGARGTAHAGGLEAAPRPRYAGPTPACVRSSPTVAAWAPQLDSLLDSLAATGRAGALVVSARGGVTCARGFGLASRGAGGAGGAEVRNTPSTLFDLGSIPKSFTAVALFQLRERGRVRLTDSLARFFAAAPPDKRGITLWQLLTHSSGLQLYIDTTGGDFERLTRDSALALAFAQPLRFPPGSREAYSNTGYTVLAAVVERACGCEFEAYLRAHVFAPAGMRHTFFWGDGRLRRFRGVVATGYVGDSALGRPRTWPRTWAARGANGVVASPEDVARFGAALTAGRLLSRAAQRDMYAAPFRRYAAGWDAFRADSGRVVSKGGSSDYGFKGQLRRHVTQGAEIALLFNAVPDRRDEPHQAFGPRVSTIVLGQPFSR